MRMMFTPYGMMFTADESDEGIPRIIQEMLKPEKIMQHGRATIFFWRDGTKTVVKLQEGDEPDIYGAYANAVAKKVFGSRTAFKNVIDDMLQVETKKGDSDGVVPTSE
ncbi:MAG: hypothetical protein PHY44_09005 [Lachnospiraceae bacterium]|nr:hypothetical protein [Lachnospiraceae bacterium]